MHDIVEVDVPPLTYPGIDGHGDRNTSADDADAVSAWFELARRVPS